MVKTKIEKKKDLKNSLIISGLFILIGLILAVYTVSSSGLKNGLFNIEFIIGAILIIVGILGLSSYNKKIKKFKDKKVFHGEVNLEMKKKQRKQLAWFFGIVIFAFLIVIGIYLYSQSSNKFSYAGIEFQKINYNGLTLYYSNFPIVINGDIKAHYNLYLRNDPRINNVSVNASYSFYPRVVLTTEIAADNCYGSGMADYNLIQFFSAVGFNITGAYTDKAIADAKQAAYVTCNNTINQTVILIQKDNSTEPSITQYSNKDCYIVNVGNCENVKAIEKLIVSLINQTNQKAIK